MEFNRRIIKYCVLASSFMALFIGFIFLFVFSIFILPKFISWFWCLLISLFSVYFGGFTFLGLVYNVERIF